MTNKITVTGQNLTFSDFNKVVYDYAKVELSKESIKKMTLSRNLVEDLLDDRKTVYGVTTGFGKFSDQMIRPEQAKELQYNLLRSHACGVGEPLSEPFVRGMMLLRINALAKGYSGIHTQTVQMLIELLNQRIHPVIPSQGSLGASGDLAPLSHMCLPLIGLGEVEYCAQRRKTIEVFQEMGIAPLELEAKEGLALINGTQMMCSLLTICLLHTETLFLAADIISSMTVEALKGIPKAFHPLLHSIRGQKGQIVTAKNLSLLLKNSKRVTNPGEYRVQDAYSLRCIPQVHGASKDAYRFVKDIVSVEMNAATDNPLIFTEIEEVISGGNFHGQPLALSADFLSIAVSEIANISERRIERLVNPQLSGLPPFLTEQGGLHSGYMILQYVAASLVSENKTLCHPASIDSIPSSANQEDHVSMGSIAARKCWNIIQNAIKVLAIEYICAAQAIGFSNEPLGDGTKIAYELIRQSIPPLLADREGHEDIHIAEELITQGKLVQSVKEVIELN